MTGEEPRPGGGTKTVKRAIAAIDAYASSDNYSYEGGRMDAYVDLIADLLRAAHAEGIDHVKVRDLAELHADAELAEG